jgi:hypothetical protein
MRLSTSLMAERRAIYELLALADYWLDPPQTADSMPPAENTWIRSL